jgi:hypothetical protein
MPYSCKIRSILSSHLRLDLPSSLFPSGPHLYHACYISYPSHSPCLGNRNNIWWGVYVQIIRLLVMLFNFQSTHIFPYFCQKLQVVHSFSCPHNISSRTGYSLIYLLSTLWAYSGIQSYGLRRERLFILAKWNQHYIIDFFDHMPFLSPLIQSGLVDRIYISCTSLLVSAGIDHPAKWLGLKRPNCEADHWSPAKI